MPSSFRVETSFQPSALPSDPVAQAAYWAELAEQQLAILDALPTAIGLIKDHRVVWVNQAFTTLLGYELEESRRLPTSTYFHDVPRFEATMREADSGLARGCTYKTDVVMRRKNGECFWGEVSGRLLFPAQPNAGLVWMLTDISERKRVEDDLKLTQDRLEAAQAQAKIGSWELGTDLDAHYWSRQMYALLGFDPNRGIPQTAEVFEGIHPEDRLAWKESVRSAFATREQVRIEFRSNPALGPLRYFEAKVRLEIDEVGKPMRVLGTTQDVTERKQIEEALRASEARLDTAQAHARIGSWEQGSDPVDRYWSKEMYALYGFDPTLGVPSANDVLAHIHPEDHQALRDAYRLAARTDQAVRVEFRSHPSCGKLRYFETFIHTARDGEGQLLRAVGTTQDITTRKQVEDALRTSEARLERAQLQAKIGSFEFEPTTFKMFHSKGMARLLGQEHTLSPIGADEGMSMTHPEERQRLREALHGAIASNEQVVLEVRGPDRPGEPPKYFETTMAPVRAEDGELLHVAGTFQDVTERRLAANALRDSEQRLQRLLENSNDVIAILDLKGRQRSLRGSLKAMLGYEPAELEGSAVLELMHPDDIAGAERAIAAAIEHPGLPYRAEYRYRHKQGGWVEMEAVGTSWLDDPIIRGIVVNIRQTTERKQSERERIKLQGQLEQASKMEAVGRLAGGVAHDFNNLLTVIAGNVELAQDELAPDAPVMQCLAEIGDAAVSATSLTRQLLAFSRRQLIEPKVLNLNELIVKLRSMLGRLIGEDISLELRLFDALGAVRIDPGQFNQVIVNLAVNAHDAMPKGGRLTIETANLDLDENFCRTHREVEPGPFVSLTVTDSGEGMTAEVLSHIFEPFFTTKPQGAGTGLGLSVIFGVVKQAGGALNAYSEPGLGSTFKIYLPRVDAPVQKLETTKANIEALHGTETILLVEDNTHVRDLTTTMLRRFGYQTFVAVNGKSALALVHAEHPAIDLLLTDLIMPEMSGRELGDQICALYPHVAVLYCSGYTEDTFVRHGLAAENLQFIGKPFTMLQLGMKLRQLLDERRRAQ